ncbi:Csi2p KNAG_0I01730 [Huiozyma naganishii CBS 8797]|uniref:Uncharacterized protein n=1 Tax=Huiozyma naganishii (strain ATCC MYA-139 / BCRC 22969 / CBS 8797 / KCTC 17520 / NBRC 10181 / NCYC 3082 / Yp74L-3) TaxID=1071383 RepID=J7RQB1_HUIN7|nr:hypothetical protein KNAG_0I01730 [Kazachstania naganishii CBS 8797]CCK71958.1 hypothetical protein KNAG_0I01730 [Kazachstania naganishii CBS 8797]
MSEQKQQHHRHDSRFARYRRDMPKLVTARTTSSSSTSTSATSTTESSTSSSTPSNSSSSSSGASITASSSSSSTTSYHTSSTSSTAPSSIAILNKENTPYLHRDTQLNGTVYIAFASCLGALLLVILILWIVMNLRAWHNAKRENNKRDIEKMSYNPVDTASLTSSSISNLSYSDNGQDEDLDLDMDEKYSSLFISPTDLIRNGNSNKDMRHGKQQPAFALPSSINIPSTATPSTERKLFRPASVHLDELLDQ